MKEISGLECFCDVQCYVLYSEEFCIVFWSVLCCIWNVLCCIVSYLKLIVLYCEVYCVVFWWEVYPTLQHNVLNCIEAYCITLYLEWCIILFSILYCIVCEAYSIVKRIILYCNMKLSVWFSDVLYCIVQLEHAFLWGILPGHWGFLYCIVKRIVLYSEA